MSTSDIDPRDEHQPDHAFDRLRSSDPAATAEPDATVIRAKVDTTATDTMATAPAAGSVVDLAAQRRTRRPARWLQIAAAAAGVVAVGGGAFFAGQQSADTPISAETADTRTATPSPAAADAPVAGAAGTGFAAGGQPGARSESTAMASMDIAGTFYGRTVFTSSGLSDASSSAQAWGYDPAATFSAETAARLGAALGMAGEPVLNYGSWHIGSMDWTTAALDLSSDGQTSFYFSDPEIQPWVESSTAAAASDEDAIAAVTAVMTELGLDPAGYAITTDSQDPSATSVEATPTQSTEGNGTWYAVVTTDGMASLSGALAPLVDLGSYDVVSPQTAVDRLSDERFGAAQSFSPYAEGAGGVARGMDTMAVVPDDPAAVPTLPGAMAAGAAIAWPVTNVTITGATLGTSTYYQPDGSVALLPTYTLTGADGSSWTVLAVADAHLDFAATS